MLSFISAAFAEDFKTTDGKEYKDATVTRIEPDGIVLRMKSGISKLYFTELSKDVQERFQYDAQKATAYSAQQAANYAAYQKQQEETQRQQDDVAAKNKAVFEHQQAINNRNQALQDRNAALQQKRDEALLRQANQPTSAHRRYTTVLHQLPVTRSQPAPQSQPNDKKQSKKPRHQ